MNNKIVALSLVLIIWGLSAEPLSSAIPSGLAANITMGEVNVLSTDDSGNGNLLVAQKTTLSQDATIQSLNFYVSSATGQLALGVYSDANGAPQSLLATTPAFTPIAGWNIQSVTSPALLKAGTYWLAYLPSSNSLQFRSETSGNAAWSSHTFGSMPASFPGSPTSGTYHWSFYAALTANVNPAATPTLEPPATPTPIATSTKTPTPTASPPAGPLYPLRASSNGRYLVDQNNVPFLIVADSPHAMIGNLSLTDANTYLRSRHATGVNALWTEMFCSTYSSICPSYTTYDGIAPFAWSNNDPNTFDLAAPNEAYFSRVDAMINLAAQDGINLFLDPTETGGWMTIYERNGATKAHGFGVYLGNRYKNYPNIVWLHGNDFQTWRNSTDDSIIQAVANGIQSVDSNHLQTVELDYPTSGSLDDPTWAPIIGLDSAYSYYSPYDQVLREYDRSSFIPIYFLEGVYEYQGYMAGYQGPHELRAQEYWTQLSGSTGIFYGNANLYPFPPGWQTAANPDGSNWQTSPGILQLGYVKSLFQNRAWYDLVPDQNHTVVTSGYGTYQSITARVMGNTSDYATTAMTTDRLLAITYMPTIRTITVDMSKFASMVTAQWYDPTNGKYIAIPNSPLANTGLHQFVPTGSNSEGAGDWVLVLETSSGSTPTTAPTLASTSTPTSPVPTSTNGGTSTAAPSATPSALRIGESSILGSDGKGSGNVLAAQKTTLSTSATIKSLSFYVAGAAGKLRLGIYDDLSGKPHRLMAFTPEITPVAGWNTQSVTTPIVLPAGTYWLAFLPQSNNLHFRFANNGNAVWFRHTYGALPNTFSSSVTSASEHWSFSGTLIP